jgi:streptogramin lyase
MLTSPPAVAAEIQYFNVPQGDHPHDVAPAPDGTVWYTGQRAGVLGRLDPNTGQVERIHWGKDRRRMASLSVPTARPGSPTVGSMPLSGSIQPRAR